MNYYQKQQLFRIALLLISIILITFIIYSFVKFIWFSDERDGKKAIMDFYALEQDGNFAESWEKFHPIIQAKFDKSHYIQDRAHVFLNHFNIDTFHVEYGELEKIKTWKMDQESETLSNVYHMPVTMIIKGKYGNFQIIQDVYTVKIDKDWKILWDYSK